jgi:hypothetical protein
LHFFYYFTTDIWTKNHISFSGKFFRQPFFLHILLEFPDPALKGAGRLKYQKIETPQMPVGWRVFRRSRREGYRSHGGTRTQSRKHV